MRAFALLVLAVAGCGDPTLGVGDLVDGALTDADTRIHPGAVVDVIRVHVGADERAAIVVTSDELAPFVIVASPDEPWGVASGEAAGPGACVVVGDVEPLDLVVHVSSAGGATLGNYQLTVAPFSHELAAAHDCQVGGPGEHPAIPSRAPTLTAGSPWGGDDRRPRSV